MECGELGTLGSHAPEHVAEDCAIESVTAMHLHLKMVVDNAEAMESTLKTVTTIHAMVRMKIPELPNANFLKIWLFLSCLV